MFDVRIIGHVHTPPLRPAILDDRLWFPPATLALTDEDANGLVAVGGDLSIERLLLAYRSGIFPWTDHPVTWWSPNPRGIFELNSFHLSHSLKRTLHRGRFEVTCDRAFRAVIEACAEPTPARPTTWITPAFVSAYCALHRAGFAHSFESWKHGRLVGGIYGVAVGGLFAGESMFQRLPDGSKVALAKLVEHLRSRGFSLFDIQTVTPHTRRLGAVEISRDDYLERLSAAMAKGGSWT